MFLNNEKLMNTILPIFAGLWKFAKQNEVYFNKSLKEFNLGNSSLENLEFLRLKYPRTPKNLEFLGIQV